MAYAAPRALQRAMRLLVLRFLYPIGPDAPTESGNTYPCGAVPLGGMPIRAPCGVGLNSGTGHTHRPGGYGRATPFGVPLHIHRCANVGGPPTGIFVSHLL